MNDLTSLLTQSYGYLLEDALLQEIVSVAVEKKVTKGDVLINYRQPILHVPLLLNGAIKISRLDDVNDELLLYFLERGDTCSMTMSCCVGNKISEIRAVAEQDTHLVLIPVHYMITWIEKYQSWRTFVFDSYNTRFNELLGAIDSLAFKNMHDRLHNYLTDKVMINKTKKIDITHQEIAYDLHSSRVVISRLLKALENEGAIKLFRNKIEVLDF